MAILVVDDDPESRDRLGTALRESGEPLSRRASLTSEHAHDLLFRESAFPHVALLRAGAAAISNGRVLGGQVIGGKLEGHG